MGWYYAAAAAAGGGTVTIGTPSTAVRAGNVETIVVTDAVVPSGSNRLLVVYILAGDATIGDRTVDSVVSNQGGTFLHLTAADADDANFTRSEIWYMIAPAVATHQVTVDFGGAAACEKGQVLCVPYTQCHQTTPMGAGIAVNGTSPGTDPTTGSQTIGTGEMLTACIVTDDESLTLTLGTNIQLFQNYATDVSFGVARLAATGAITWQTLGNQTYAISAVVLKPN